MIIICNNLVKSENLLNDQIVLHNYFKELLVLSKR